MSRISPLLPINSTAARVVSAGTHYVADKKHGSAVYELKPPTRRATLKERQLPGYLDLIGVRRGRLVVVGQADVAALNWVARCDCGSFVIRTNKAMRNAANEADACEECRHILYAKRAELWRRTGKHVELKEFV